MSNSTKAAFWQKHFADWPQIGLSQKAYCARHNLKLTTGGLRLTVTLSALEPVLSIMRRLQAAA